MDESEKLKENRIGAVIFYLVIVLIVVLAFKYYQKVLSGEVDHSGESVKSSMERCLRLHANGGDYWNVWDCKKFCVSVTSLKS